MAPTEWKHIYDLVGAAMEVFNELGWGMAEAIYQSALKEEFTLRKIHFKKKLLLKPIIREKNLTNSMLLISCLKMS